MDYIVTLFKRDKSIYRRLIYLDISNIREIVKKYLEIDKDYYKINGLKNPLDYNKRELSKVSTDLYENLLSLEEETFVFGDENYYYYLFEKANIEFTDEIYLQPKRLGIWDKIIE